MAALDLSSARVRAKLKPRSSAYSHRLSKGVSVLLYVGKRGQTWRARVPEKADASIGDAAVMTFEEAVAATMKRARAGEEIAPEAEVADRTIGAAWAAYEDRARQTKSAQAWRQIRSYGRAIAPLADRPIASTPLPILNRWRDGLISTTASPTRARTRSAVTVNKIVRSLKAALNADGVSGPWSGLAPLDERDVAQEERPVLDAAGVRQVIRAAYAHDPAVGRLVEALARTGARPSEIMGVRRQDHRTGVLTIPSGKTGRRLVTLTPAHDRWFAAQAKGSKAKGALMFTRADGRAWTMDALGKAWAAMMEGPEAEGLPAITSYVLRHSFITLALYASVPPFALARQVGTSVAMVEATYGHVLAELQAHAFAALDDALGLDDA